MKKTIILYLATLLTTVPFGTVYSVENNELDFDTGYKALMTATISVEAAKKEYPGLESVKMGSLAGYLNTETDGVHYHLVALPSRSIKYKSKYVSTIKIIDVSGFEGAVLTPKITEQWVKIGLLGDPEYKIHMTQVGQVFVTIFSDKPFAEMLNPSAKHTTPK